MFITQRFRNTLMRLAPKIRRADKETTTPSVPRLLAADLWAVFNMDAPDARLKKFLQHGRLAFKRLADGILLHQQVVVPTQDFLSLTLLVSVFGEEAIIDLLDAECLRFIRIRNSLSYVGNGGGIQSFTIHPEDQKPGPLNAPLDHTVTEALRLLKDPPKDPRLSQLVLQATQEISLDEELAQQIRHETYMDVLNSPYLRNVFAIRNTHMERLAGVAPNQVRVYGGPYEGFKGDEIDVVLALAAANTELRLAKITGCEDSSTASPIGHLLKGKADRALGGKDASNAFAILREITDIPDVGENVLQRRVAIRKLLAIRRSRNGEQFRKWFHATCRQDPITTGKEYTALLRKIPTVRCGPIRFLRYIVTSAVSAIPIYGAAAGATVGAVDSFFLEDWLKGRSPKFFIDELQQIQKPGV